ncbi:MAG: RluA family pseudouridine synthase, partial [Acidobacteria bacterium]|nr:RluA family pseudouridine synthase [Acidobacteriota bacterium]
LVAIDKPAGMVVHAGAGIHAGTLVNALLHRFGTLSESNGSLRPGIVHRLDRQTSGLLVVAKTDVAHRRLARQFAGREVHKTYIALVHGWPSSECGTIGSPIGRDLKHRSRMAAGRGRDAVTHYNVVRRIHGTLGKFALLNVRIETGRTHQIRVHMASLGHPVVGDYLYGAPRQLRGAHRSSPTLGRNFLHAAAIEFIHPETHETIHLEAPLPPELQQFLADMQKPDGK